MRQHNDDNTISVLYLLLFANKTCTENNNRIIIPIFVSERTRCRRSLRVHWANGTINTVPCWPHWDVLWEPLTSVGSPYLQYNLEVSLVVHNNRYIFRYTHNVTLQIVCNVCVSCNIVIQCYFSRPKNKQISLKTLIFFIIYDHCKVFCGNG